MRTSSKRSPVARVLFGLIVIATVWALLWGSATWLLPRLASQAHAPITALLRAHRIELEELTVSRLRVSPWLDALRLGQVHARFDLNPDDRIHLSSRLDIAEVGVQLTQPLGLRGRITLQGLELTIDPADRSPSLPLERLSDGVLRIDALPLSDPGRVATILREKLRRLFFENQAVGEVELSARVWIDIGGEAWAARLYTKPVGEGFKLRFHADDIQAISAAKGMDLVAEQIEIVTDYPLRAPVILVLTDRARALAKAEAPDDHWLADALRHVIWSFFLTRTFGPEFATLVTDAQELRPDNTPNERAMDFHNNAIGRQLSATSVTLEEIPRYAREDPRIIRHPDEVARIGEERLLR
ncbi:MAG: hypothetical protein EOM91_15350 [Sphingobacteriia bacterium]|nr:hypothetical protein [Sphingobacteriia bacterium]NCC41240.1 hypothetical protein [Gammaproteobacteria bacterium]